MDSRFQNQTPIENGGMFSREKIQDLTKQMISLYGTNGVLGPQDIARCMIDTYRGMNKHFIPTGYELSSFARVFDKNKKGSINQEDIKDTANRMFLSQNQNSSFR